MGGLGPIHVKLWASTSRTDDFLDRIFIVHNYLEGAGLDASTTLLKKLNAVECSHLKATVNRIAKDEEGHVEFGTHWFKKACLKESLDPDQEFKTRLYQLSPRLPRRVERINVELRKSLGFSSGQIQVLSDFRTARLAREASTAPP